MSISNYEFVQISKLLNGDAVVGKDNHHCMSGKFAINIKKGEGNLGLFYTEIFEFHNGIRCGYVEDEYIQLMRNPIWELCCSEKPDKSLHDILFETIEVIEEKENVEMSSGKILTTRAYITALLIAKGEYSEQKVQEIQNEIYNNIFVQMDQFFEIDLLELNIVMKEWKYLFRGEHYINLLTTQNKKAIEVISDVGKNHIQLDVVSKDQLCRLEIYQDDREVIWEIAIKYQDKCETYIYDYNLKDKTETLRCNIKNSRSKHNVTLNLQTGYINNSMIEQYQLDDLVINIRKVIEIVEEKILIHVPNYKKLGK